MIMNFVFLAYAYSYDLFRPTFIERNSIAISFSQKMNYHHGVEYGIYHSDGISIEEDKIQFFQPGKVVLNIPMTEGVDYAIQFSFEGLNANHIVCVGIGGQGFILSEVLGIESSKMSHYQLGYCSDGTNASKYPDTYSDFNEFDEMNDDTEIDEIEYNYGTSEMDNKFNGDHFYMVLRDTDLIYMDHKDNIFMVYNQLDRSRSYIPIITMHLRNEVKQKLIKKKKCVIVEEFQFVQLVANFNPFKKDLPKELKDKLEQDQQEKEKNKQTELAKQLQEKKIQAGEDIIEDEGEDQISDQLKEQLRTQETKDLHNKVDEVLSSEEEISSEDQGEQEVDGNMEEQLTASDDNVNDDQAQSGIEQKHLSGEEEGEFQDESGFAEEEVQEIKPEDDDTESHVKIMNVQSHLIKTQLFTRSIIPLRPSLIVEDFYTIYQDNTKLSKPLQEYKSCSYAYLDIKPSRSNYYLSVIVDNVDDLYNPYPIGVGVYAYQMLDRLKGWRNLQDQLWCLDKESEDLWQYGALYRSDGTFIDSYMFGEYFKYKVDKKAERSTKIKIYFSNNNRVAFAFDDDKSLVLTCVNPKFKFYVPIFELKAYKGIPSLTLEEFVQDAEMPFKYSDNDDALYANFEAQHFNIIQNYYVEKRNSYNEEDDDFTLSGVENQKINTASINMWDTRLFEDPIEWWIKIESIHDNKDQIQMCIGINQMSSESIIETVFDKNYKPQVAYLCDKYDFIHTFFQECPISQNTILFVPGTILRIRISNYLMQIFDGYTIVYFSLRQAGRTGVVPSAIIRAHPDNIIKFLTEPQPHFGPNPFENRVDQAQLDAEHFASYDVFTLPILENAKNGLFKPHTKEPLFKEKKQAKVETDKIPPIGRKHQETTEESKKLEDEKELKKQEVEEQSIEQTEKVQNQDKSEGLTVSQIPQEIDADQNGNSNLRCLIVYEHCNFQGADKVLYPHKIEKGPPQSFRSYELCKDTEQIKIIIEGHVQEQMIITNSVECLPSPIYIKDIDIV